MYKKNKRIVQYLYEPSFYHQKFKYKPDGSFIYILLVRTYAFRYCESNAIMYIIFENRKK